METGSPLRAVLGTASDPCVFTPYAACPPPPAQNRLSVAIEAGEKMYLAETG